MKVTVCFGQVRILVPCGNGKLLVRDLAQQAVHRYCKASGQIEDTWNQTATLRSSDGAILDPDDKLNDVVDDREILTASLGPIVIQPDSVRQGSRGSNLRADGTSASSEGSPSPEPNQIGSHHTFQPFARQAIEVTGEEKSDVPLQVRRGSEPTLHRLQSDTRPTIDVSDSKRWSAAVVLEDENNKNTSFECSEDESFLEERRVGSGREDELSAFARFVRNSNRMSMQPYGAVQWEDAADNAAAVQPMHFRSQSHDETPRPGSLRREPVGSTCPPPEPCGSHASVHGRTETVVLVNDGSALGIHVVPAYDREGRDHGLSVQGVEPGGRVYRDGRVVAGDKIIEINGRSLQYVPFQRSQEIFRQAMQCHELRLVAIKRLERPDSRNVKQLSEERMVSDGSNERMVGRDPSATSASSLTRRNNEPGSSNVLATGNTRKIGRMYEIDLIKGPKGLGFSVTTRDNPAGGDCPIYVKKILPEGAAIEDGRLRAGDRLLEVNGISMTGKLQEEAVSILRGVSPKGIARIVVSRQDAVEPSPTLPRKLGVSQESLTTPSNFRNREILTLDIPVHDTEKAGLGISVKGKTSSQPNGATIDLGIFIKSVIHGGAASRDGRLKPNDQLLSVNGSSLAGLTNSEAMTTLRKLVHSEGPIQGCITLTVARKIGETSGRESTSSMLSNSSGQENCGKSDSGTTDNSGNSDSSGKTVIFVGSGSAYGNNNEDTNQNQLRVLPIRDTTEERLEPPPRAPPNPNPMIDRLVGNQNSRNENYYRTSHDTWSSSQNYESSHRYEQRGRQQYGDHTFSTAQGENVLIQDDYVLRSNQNPRNDGNQLYSDQYQTDMIRKGNHTFPAQVIEAASSDRASVRSDRPSDSETLPYESQTSLDESTPGFTRDQPGRQSMSEKRHATLDAKSTDTYQRQKKAKEDRGKNTETPQPENPPEEMISPRVDNVGRVRSFENVATMSTNHAVYSEIRKQKEVGPALGLKKSSSLESLQTMVHEIQMQGDQNYPFRQTAGKSNRSRTTYDTSRSTVYQSQDSQDDTLGEEENQEPPTAALDLAGQNIYGRTQDPKKISKTKKSSLLKGLGSMFRFGKHRKAGEGASESPVPTEYIQHQPSPQDLSRHILRRTLPHERSRATTEPPQAEGERVKARQVAEDEQRRIQEQYRRLVERGKGPPGLGEMILPPSRHRVPPPSHQGPPPYSQTHRQEDVYGRIRQRPASSQDTTVHGRSSSFDSAARPGGRQEPPSYPPNYANVEETNQQLSRRQQQYRSQRSHRESREVKTDRPSSNYFEYESIQNPVAARPTISNYPPRFQPDLPTIQQGGKAKPPYPLPPGPPQGHQPQPNQSQRKQDRSHTTGYGRDKRLPLQSSIFDPLGPPRQQTHHSHPRYQQNRQPPYPPPPPGPPGYHQPERHSQRSGGAVLSGSKV